MSDYGVFFFEKNCGKPHNLTKTKTVVFQLRVKILIYFFLYKTFKLVLEDSS